MVNLQNLFVGLVKQYRSLSLRFQPKLESMTQWTRAELSWFADLGESLGFISVFEKDVFRHGRPVDLAWVDPFSYEVIFHLERENDPNRILDTIDGKLLRIDGICARYCCGIFDEVSEEMLPNVKSIANRAFLRSHNCRELLIILYSHIPTVGPPGSKDIPRFETEWPVHAIHFQRGCQPKVLRAVCTTDKNYCYTMYLVDPKIRPPYKSLETF